MPYGGFWRAALVQAGARSGPITHSAAGRNPTFSVAVDNEFRAVSPAGSWGIDRSWFCTPPNTLQSTAGYTISMGSPWTSLVGFGGKVRSSGSGWHAVNAATAASNMSS